MTKSAQPAHEQLFTRLEDSYVVLTTKGIKTPQPVFLYKDELYAPVGRSFIRLRPQGLTSQITTLWDDLHVPYYSIQQDGIRLIATRASRAPIAVVK